MKEADGRAEDPHLPWEVSLPQNCAAMDGAASQYWSNSTRSGQTEAKRKSESQNLLGVWAK